MPTSTRRGLNRLRRTHSRLLTTALLAAGVSFPLAAQGRPAVPFWSVARPDAVCSMSGTWAIGLGTHLPNLTNVNVEFLTKGGRRFIQALHRSVTPGEADYDLFLVDAATLHPIETANTGPVPPVRFRFDSVGSAVKLSADGGVEERITLSGFAIAEGPGLEIVVQAIPWADRLTLSGTMLDRWRGVGQARNRAMTWRVEGRERRTTLAGTHELFRTRLAPDDGSYEVVAFVTTERPHWVARMEYRAGAGQPTRISELREVAFNCDGMASSLDAS